MSDIFNLTTFANLNPPWSLPALDANFSAHSTGLKDLRLSVKDPQFGAKGDGVTNDAVAIQAAITASTAIGSAIVYFPPGNYYIGSTTITLPNETNIIGAGMAAAVIEYAGAGDALRYNNGLANSSGYANVRISDLKIRHTGVGGPDTGAGIELNSGGWSYFFLDRVWITGIFKYGVIFDQSEVAHIFDSIVENGVGTGGSAHVWLTNGDARTPTAAGYTNRVDIQRNQFNGAETGVAIDGGSDHSIVYNNFNGQLLPIRLAGATCTVIYGNGLEGDQTLGTGNILVTDSGLTGDVPANKGGCQSGVILGNNMGTSAIGGNSMLAFNDSHGNWHQGFVVKGNIFQATIGVRTFAINVGSVRGSEIGPNTDRIAAGTHYGNIHNDSNGNTLLYPYASGALTDLQQNIYGRTDIVQRVAALSPGGFGAGTGAALNTVSQRIVYGNAAPTAGAWIVGDAVINQVPAVGQPKGWRCTVAGSPGTWVSEGNL